MNLIDKLSELEGSELLKIQRPISTNEPDPFALVYNEDRTTEVHVSLSKFSHILDLFEENEYKVYWYGKVNEDGHLLLDRPEPDPPDW